MNRFINVLIVITAVVSGTKTVFADAADPNLIEVIKSDNDMIIILAAAVIVIIAAVILLVRSMKKRRKKETGR